MAMTGILPPCVRACGWWGRSILGRRRPGHDLLERGSECVGIMSGQVRPGPEIAIDHDGTECCRRSVETLAVGGSSGIRDDDVNAQIGVLLPEHLQVRLRTKPGGLPRLRLEVYYHSPLSTGATKRIGEVGDKKVWQHAGEPRAGTEDHPVGGINSGDGLSTSRWLVWDERDGEDLSLSRGDRCLPVNLFRCSILNRLSARLVFWQGRNGGTDIK